MGTESELRQAVVDVCRRMHGRGYIAAKDGNVSVRWGDGLLVTPSGRPKGFLRPEDLVRVAVDGTPAPGQSHQPSSELGMHLAVFHARADVQAVVHAHPPAAVAHTVAGISLEAPLMPEALVELGRVPTVPFTHPGTPEVAARIREVIAAHDVIMLSRHGSLTVGPDLETAYGRLEVLEHTARVSVYARSLAPGGVQPLPPDVQSRLLQPSAGGDPPD